MLKYKCSYKENGACYVVVASTWLILLVLSVKLFCNARNVNGVKYTLSCSLSLLSEGQAGAACELSNTVALFWKSAALIPLRRNDTQELAWSNIFCLSWNVELSCALMTACRGRGVWLHPLLTSTAGGGVWSAWHAGRPTPVQRTHWVVSNTGPDVLWLSCTAPPVLFVFLVFFRSLFTFFRSLFYLFVFVLHFLSFAS